MGIVTPACLNFLSQSIIVRQSGSTIPRPFSAASGAGSEIEVLNGFCHTCSPGFPRLGLEYRLETFCSGRGRPDWRGRSPCAIPPRQHSTPSTTPFALAPFSASAIVLQPQTRPPSFVLQWHRCRRVARLRILSLHLGLYRPLRSRPSFERRRFPGMSPADSADVGFHLRFESIPLRFQLRLRVGPKLSGSR